jgi:hypothetical protein
MSLGSLRFLAQYELFSEYIANTLCINKDIPNNDCQGQCHLNNEIINYIEEGDNEETALLTETTNILLYPCERITFVTKSFLTDQIIWKFNEAQYPYNPYFAYFHPPTV